MASKRTAAHNLTPDICNCVTRFKAWARGQPTLRRVWLYGSCALGTETAESDIDVAFEIDPLPDDASKSVFGTETFPSWRSELQSLSTLEVHLEPWAVVRDFVATTGVLIYERAA